MKLLTICKFAWLAMAVIVLPSAFAQEQPKYGGNLVIGVSADIQNFDPQFSSGVESTIIQEAIFERLVRLDSKGNLLPELAESWQVVDPKTYVFKLRRGVKFHDGSDFNAEAVKWNFDFARDPKNATSVGGQLSVIDSVTVVDPYTVRFNLKAPFSAFPTRLASWVAKVKSKEAYEKFGKEQSATNPVGTGPFMLKEWRRNQHVRMVRNPNYWDKKLPYLDQVEFRPIPDESVKVTNLRTGNVHLINSVPGQSVAALKSERDMVVAETEGWAQEILWFNTRRPPFNNPNLRLAVARSIDRAAIVKALYFGKATPGTAGLPPSSWAFKPGLKSASYDPQGAKRAMAESGLTNVKVNLLVPTAKPIHKREAELIQEAVKPLGIDVQIEVLETGAWWARVLAKEHDFDMAIKDFNLSPDPDEYYSLNIPCKEQYNLSGVCDEEMEREFNLGRAVADRAQRKPHYEKLQELVDQRAPFVIIAFREQVEAHSSRVKGYSPRGHSLIRLHEVWLDK